LTILVEPYNGGTVTLEGKRGTKLQEPAASSGKGEQIPLPSACAGNSFWHPYMKYPETM